jgi:hypothetical protein
MDCRLMICELLGELKAVKASYLEEQLLWQGADRSEISASIRVLQERGVIYKGRGGILALTEPFEN